MPCVTHRSVILIELSHAELVLGRQLNVVGRVRIEVTHHETRDVGRDFLGEEIRPCVVVRPAVLQRNCGKMLGSCHNNGNTEGSVRLVTGLG